MSREEFCNHYLESAERRMALRLLEPGDRSLAEWRGIWSRVLNSPAQ